MTDQFQPLERFSALIDTHGSQLHRWPADRQAWAKALVASSPDAALLLREARALDEVLGQAPQIGSGRSTTLSEAIVAAAMASGIDRAAHKLAEQPSGHNIVRLPLHHSRSATASVSAALQPRQPMSLRWRAAAGLAASLMMGVLIGTYDLAPASLSGLVDTVGKDQDVELFVTSLGGDGLTPSLDEDYL